MTHLRDLVFDPRNARQHTPRNIGMIAESLQKYGPARSISIDEDNVILAGNGVVEAAMQIGVEHVRIYDRETGELEPAPPDGKPYIFAVRISGLTPQERASYAVADNRTGELSAWNPDVLAGLADDGVDLSQFWFEDEMADLLADDDDVTDLDAESVNAYTKDTPSPVYTPTGEEPDIAELADTTRRDDLIGAIQEATVPDDIRQFLVMAAQRHIVFDYRKIAEFYAHADADTQRLMEDSALVIPDFNRAIELGYVRLSSRLNDLLGEALAHAAD